MSSGGKASTTLLKYVYKMQRIVRRKQALRAAAAEQQWILFTDLDAQDEAERLELAVFMQTLIDSVAQAKTQINVLDRLKDSFVMEDEFNTRFDNSDSNISSKSAPISLDKLEVSFDSSKYEKYNILGDEVTPKIAMDIMEVYRDGREVGFATIKFIICKVYWVLKDMPTVSRLSVPEGAKLNVVGDIHGQLRDLLHILDEGGVPSASNKYVFNGDFVDRGDQGLEVIIILFAWFLAVGPDVVCLNRGNHEDGALNRVYGFKLELDSKVGQDSVQIGEEEIFEKFRRVYKHLPLFALVDDSILIVHGGIFHTPHVTMDELNQIQRWDYMIKPKVPYPLCAEGMSAEGARAEFLKQLQREAMWSDPSPEAGIHRSTRGAGYFFGPDVADQFMKLNGIDMIIRSHQCVYDGFDFPYDTTSPTNSPIRDLSTVPDVSDAIPAGVVPLATVFSASGYCQKNNKGAFMTFRANHFEQSHAVGGKSKLHYSVHRFEFPELLQKSSTIEQSNRTSLRDLVLKKKFALTAAFAAADVENDGYVSRVQWAEIMQQITGVMIRWNAVIDSIAPAEALTATHIDYKKFMAHFSVAHSDAADKISPRIDLAAMDYLYGERRKLEALFYLFDTNHDGEISPEEFSAGCVKLNAMLHPDCQLLNFEHMMRLMDLGKTGTININEFFEAFRILDGKSGSIDGVLGSSF